MIAIRNNKLLFAFLVLAVLSFAFLSLGGQYLHHHIHHDESGTEQDCSFSQFLAQALLVFLALILAAFLKVSLSSIRIFRIFVFQAPRILPQLRAPPILA